MKKIAFILAFLLAAVPAFAGTNIKTKLAFDTTPFVCDGVNHISGQPGNVSHFVNTTGKPMFIKQMQMWFGMGMTGVGDFWSKVNRLSDGAYLGGTNWDHYAEPTGMHQLYYTYQPDHIYIAAGDGLAIEYGCLTPGTINGHVVSYIWYTEHP
jgi:hypothetical protein